MQLTHVSAKDQFGSPKPIRQLVGNTVYVSYDDVVVSGATYTEPLLVVAELARTQTQRRNDR